MNQPSSPQTPPSNGTPGAAAAPKFCSRCGAALSAEGTCGACILQGARSKGPGSGAFTARSIDQMNKALPAYECQVLVGQGGMGAVYRARHKKLDRLVAIKVLRPTATDEDSASFAERFEREARVLAKLDHPHIVRIYDFGRTEDRDGEGDGDGKGFFYLALEYVDGASLRDLMCEGRLTAKEVLELIPQVCEALQTAHALGVIHRDIKPENILVDGEGRVRIADFGLAKLSDAEPTGFGLTQTNQTFGTLHYMAPEQMRGAGTVDHRADLYSLGVVLYEMLTGELPLGRFVAPSVKNEGAKELDGVVFRALENEPDARYQGAGDLKRDLVAGGSVAPVLTRRQRRAQRKGRELGRHVVPIVRPSKADAPSRGASTSAPTAPLGSPFAAGSNAGPATGPAAGSQSGSTPASTPKAPSASGSAPRLSQARRSTATDPASTQPLLRSWVIVAVLVLLYGTFWAELRLSDLDAMTNWENGTHNLRSFGSELQIGEWNMLKAGPYSLSINGIPMWLGLASLVAAAILRTLASSGRAISRWIPASLSLLGLGLMVVLVVSFASEGLLYTLQMTFALAFFTHGWAALADLDGLWRSRR